jgi:hypothetical protein
MCNNISGTAGTLDWVKEVREKKDSILFDDISSIRENERDRCWGWGAD